MPLTDEQAKSIKEQILKQVESFPEDKREHIKSYILSMNNQELEEFMIKNKMISEEAEGNEETGESDKKNHSQTKGNQCVFCMLSNKQIESLPIYEDKDYLAALEINPISKGHIILIPKKHIPEAKSLPSKALTISNKIGRHLVKKLKAENFQINTSDELKHTIVNIIPRYKDQKISFERKPAKKQDLQDLAMTIGKFEKKQKIQKIKTDKSEKKETQEKKDTEGKKEEKSKSSIIQFPRRIP